jgi:hypothetical protein
MKLASLITVVPSGPNTGDLLDHLVCFNARGYKCAGLGLETTHFIVEGCPKTQANTSEKPHVDTLKQFDVGVRFFSPSQEVTR